MSKKYSHFSYSSKYYVTEYFLALMSGQVMCVMLWKISNPLKWLVNSCLVPLTVHRPECTPSKGQSCTVNCKRGSASLSWGWAEERILVSDAASLSNQVLWCPVCSRRRTVERLMSAASGQSSYSCVEGFHWFVNGPTWFLHTGDVHSSRCCLSRKQAKI